MRISQPLMLDKNPMWIANNNTLLSSASIKTSSPRDTATSNFIQGQMDRDLIHTNHSEETLLTAHEEEEGCQFFNLSISYFGQCCYLGLLGQCREY